MLKKYRPILALFRVLRTQVSRVQANHSLGEGVFALVLPLFSKAKTLSLENETDTEYVLWLSDFILIRSNYFAFFEMALRHIREISHPLFARVPRDELTAQIDALARLHRSLGRKKDDNQKKEEEFQSLIHKTNLFLINSMANALLDGRHFVVCLKWIESILGSGRPLVAGKEGVIGTALAFFFTFLIFIFDET